MGRELSFWERLRDKGRIKQEDRDLDICDSRLFCLEPHLLFSSRTLVFSSVKWAGWTRPALRDFAELTFRETDSTLMFSVFKG